MRKAYFEDLGESFDDTGILVAVNLDTVDEGYLRFGTVAERFEDRCEFLDSWIREGLLGSGE